MIIIMKRKYLIFALCVLFSLTMIFNTSIPVFADLSENAAYNWYTKRNDTHTLSPLDKNLSFISEYNAVYGDTKASERGDKVIYLTFDAGYENGNVEKILNVLKKHGAPGAFFVLENLIKRNPDLIRRMHDDGHLICNHTLTHPDMTKLTDRGRFAAQLNGLRDCLKQETGIDMANYYRPPEGKFSKQNLKYAEDMGYKTVFWSFAYADWDNNDQPSEQYAVKKILDNAHPGEIMLLHPTSSTNAIILDTVLTSLKADGYRFASLDELK
ncbi:MAG: delta-lactam-biosynthetic de-N-acetylase [Ruminococcaceae bacterium]|nr:delta-lactam-biosynthetic de-N-acetylase [Oscillospiraceae bacterium]